MALLTIARDTNNRYHCLYGDHEIQGSKVIEVEERMIDQIKSETLERVDWILKYLRATKPGRVKQPKNNSYEQ